MYSVLKWPSLPRLVGYQKPSYVDLAIVLQETPLGATVQIFGWAHTCHLPRAGSQEAPFLGYVELDIGIPCVEAGTDKVFSLVLVVLDNSNNQRVPLILGTNLAEQWRGDCQQKGGRDFLGERNASGTWKRAYCALSSQEEFYDTCKNASVKVRST